MLRPLGRATAALLLAALALSGCAAPTHGGRGGPDATAGPPPAETGAALPAVPLTPLNQTRTLQLDGCTGWLASITYPGPTGPGERPDGWGPAGADTLATAVEMQAYLCQRVSVGEFERGPIHLLVEGHTDAAFPQDCLADPPDARTSNKVATQLWLDDGEVAAYLRDEYGAPVTLGTFSETAQGLGPAATHTWTWSAADGEPSTMTVPDDGQAGSSTPLYERYFWANGTAGLVRLDLAPADHHSPTPEPGRGDLRPPTRFAADTGGAFAGMTAWFPERSAAGTFTAYSDRLCGHRIP